MNVIVISDDESTTVATMKAFGRLGIALPKVEPAALGAKNLSCYIKHALTPPFVIVGQKTNIAKSKKTLNLSWLSASYLTWLARLIKTRLVNFSTSYAVVPTKVEWCAGWRTGCAHGGLLYLSGFFQKVFHGVQVPAALPHPSAGPVDDAYLCQRAA